MNTDKAEHRNLIQRIGGYLHRVEPIVDSTGRVVHHMVVPLMVELKPRDILQIVVGAAILGVPVGFTEEVWQLGTRLPVTNVLLLSATSLLFIAAFVYFNFYRFHLREHRGEYIKRVCAMYVLSLVVVGILMTIIQQCPWGTDNVLALKRIAIVAFPASMSAAAVDTIK